MRKPMNPKTINCTWRSVNNWSELTKSKFIVYLAHRLKYQLKSLNDMILWSRFRGLCVSLNVRSPLIPGNVSAVQVRVCFCGMTLWQRWYLENFVIWECDKTLLYLISTSTHYDYRKLHARRKTSFTPVNIQILARRLTAVNYFVFT